MPRSAVFVLLAALAGLVSVGRVSAQDEPVSSLPSPVREAMQRGDTLAAISALEEALAANSEEDQDPAVVGELGLLLAYTAPVEELDFTQRVRARKLLETALKKDSGNPRYFLALGVVYDKALLRGDARLVIDRGLAAAAEHPGRISDGELADAFYRRGRTMEVWVEEFVDLRNVPADQAQLGRAGCQFIGDAFCENWGRPRRFFDHFGFFPDVSDVVDDDRALMVREYERAVAVDPTHDGAWRGILRARARTGEWERFLASARRWSEADPENPWSRIFLAVALAQAKEAWGEADSLFQETLFELGDEDREVFQDLKPLLGTREEETWARRGPIERDLVRRAWFKSQDPLYLSEANERRVAHYTRVALAELLFGEPRSGRRGWVTDRGQILVRYGLPESRWQVRRDDRRILRTQGLEGSPAAGDMGGGRWIFWNYDPDQPSFVFEKKLGRRSVRHMASSQSFSMARDLKADQPTSFAPPFRSLGPMPFQMALFRSLRGRTRELEVHALIPVDELLDDPEGDSVEAGLFLDRTSNWARQGEARTSQPGDEPGLDIRVRGLDPGIYQYSLEAASRDRSVASVVRGELAVRTYSASGLLLSDLLLARNVVPEVEEPATRFELSVDPLRCLAPPESGSLWVVFEVYGLETTEGVARYRIDVETDLDRGSPVVRFLRGLVSPLAGDPEAGGAGAVSYERRVEARNDRVVEWFRVGLSGQADRARELRVRVTDLRGGASAEAVRTLTPGSCPPGNEP